MTGARGVITDEREQLAQAKALDPRWAEEALGHKVFIIPVYRSAYIFSDSFCYCSAKLLLTSR